jgi:hypothetical protein
MKRSERTEAITFLRKNVIGRMVIAEPVTTSSAEGRIITAYEDQTLFTNLVETQDGFGFDLTALASGTRYTPHEDGQSFRAEGTLNAVRVYRYEITERKSSGKLVGFGRFVASSNTRSDPFSGTCFLTRVSIADGVMIVQDTQSGYSDFISSEGGFRPVASDGQYRYASEGGKLVLSYQQAIFDVDPETLKRTRSKEKFPLQVSREMEFPLPIEPEPDAREPRPVTPARPKK